MKKRTAAALVAAMLAAFGTGCDKVDEVSKITDTINVASSGTEETSQKETDSKTGKPKKESTEKLEKNKDKDKNNSIKDAEESSKTQEELEEEENNDRIREELEEAANEEYEQQQQLESEMNSDAEALYKEALDMYVGVVINSPYEFDYSNGTDDGYYPIVGVDSVDEIYNYYESVFSSSAELESRGKYKEIDGVPYCRDGGRGFDITYAGTDLEFVSGTDTEITYSAISHYEDPDTGESLGDVINGFTIVKTDGEWKVSNFTVPG